MSTKLRKPRTPGTRGQRITAYRKALSTSKPLKSLTKGTKKRAGRNNQGRITMRHQGGGAKRNLRIVDFRFDKHDIAGKVEHIDYDPHRTGFIARVVCQDG